MGPLHHDNAPDYRIVHELYATAEESGSSTRNGDIDICW